MLKVEIVTAWIKTNIFPSSRNDSQMFSCLGTTAEHVDVQVHRALPGGGVHVAEEAEHGRPGHQHLVRGAEDLVASGVDLHRV